MTDELSSKIEVSYPMSLSLVATTRKSPSTSTVDADLDLASAVTGYWLDVTL